MTLNQIGNIKMKIITNAFLALLVLLSSEAYGQSMMVKLAPNESRTISNHYLWTMNATCTIEANASVKKILIRVVKQNGKVNGRTLNTGQSTSVLVHDQDSLSVSADAGAEVNLQNLSHDAVKANCSA